MQRSACKLYSFNLPEGLVFPTISEEKKKKKKQNSSVTSDDSRSLCMAGKVSQNESVSITVGSYYFKTTAESMMTMSSPTMYRQEKATVR